MGVARTVLKWGSFGGAATVGSFFWALRNSSALPLASSDYLYNTTWYARFNSENNAPVSDVVIRTVPLKDLQPALLEKEGKLVERFCAGVWGGLGYAYQRSYLEKKYRGPETAGQLWDRKELKESTYPVGTQITDHFEVLSHTDDSIIVRCGDSPRKTGPRPSDGLFEMRADINKQLGVAEFQLKSILYQGVGKAEGPAMPWHVELLHRWYAKLWMETAVRAMMR